MPALGAPPDSPPDSGAESDVFEHRHRATVGGAFSCLSLSHRGIYEGCRLEMSSAEMDRRSPVAGVFSSLEEILVLDEAAGRYAATGYVF